MLQFARLVIFGTGIACSLSTAIAVSIVIVGSAAITGYIVGQLDE